MRMNISIVWNNNHCQSIIFECTRANRCNTIWNLYAC